MPAIPSCSPSIPGRAGWNCMARSGGTRKPANSGCGTWVWETWVSHPWAGRTTANGQGSDSIPPICSTASATRLQPTEFSGKDPIWVWSSTRVPETTIWYSSTPGPPMSSRIRATPIGHVCTSRSSTSPAIRMGLPTRGMVFRSPSRPTACVGASIRATRSSPGPAILTPCWGGTSFIVNMWPTAVRRSTRAT